MCQMFRLYLDGGARRWYKTLTDRVKQDWSELSRAFLVEFKPPSSTIEMRTKLMAMKQGGRDVRDFGTAVEDLCSRVDVTMKEDEKISYFLKGLRDVHACRAILIGAPATLREAINKAATLSAMFKSHGDVTMMEQPVAERYGGGGAGGHGGGRNYNNHGQQRYQQRGEMMETPMMQNHPPGRYQQQQQQQQPANNVPEQPRYQMLQRNNNATDNRSGGGQQVPTESRPSSGGGGAGGPAGNLRSRTPPPTSIPGASGVQCYNCQGYGHISKECPAPQRRTRSQAQAQQQDLINAAAATLQQAGASSGASTASAPQQQSASGAAGSRPVNMVAAAVTSHEEVSTEAAEKKDEESDRQDKATPTTGVRGGDAVCATLMEVSGVVSGVPARVVIDTGASCTFISKELYARIPPHARGGLLRRDNLRFSTATLGDMLEVEGLIDVKLTLGDVSLSQPVPVRVVRHLATDMLLGCDFINKHVEHIRVAKRHIQLRTGTVEFHPHSFKRKTVVPLLPYATQKDIEKQNEVYAVAQVLFDEESPLYEQPQWSHRIVNASDGESEEDREIDETAIPAYASRAAEYDLPDSNTEKMLQQLREVARDTKDTAFCSEQARQELEQLLTEFVGVFAVNPKAPGCVTDVEFTIDTGDAIPIRSRPYRLSHSQQATLDKDVEEWLNNSIIARSNSAWASPLVMVQKTKDLPKIEETDWRTCVDYRKLNAVTKKDAYPVPVSECLLLTLFLFAS